MNIESILASRELALRCFPIPDFTRGWELSDFDAGLFVAHYSALRLRPGFRFVVYCSAGMGNCSTLLYALPVGLDIVSDLTEDPREFDRDAVLNSPAEDQPHIAWSLAMDATPEQIIRPRPRGCLADFMLALQGDDTPEAYLQAALLARDGRELGAAWHGADWTSQSLLAGPPFLSPTQINEVLRLLKLHLSTTPVDPVDIYREFLPPDLALDLTAEQLCAQVNWDHKTVIAAVIWADSIYANTNKYWEFVRNDSYRIPPELARMRELPGSAPQEWVWQEGLPDEMVSVDMSAQQVVVTFFTYTAYIEERITRHVSRFQRGNYSPEMEEHRVGKGPRGYIC